MSGDGIIQVPVDGAGKKVDGASLSVGGVDIFRQRFVLGDNLANTFAEVIGTSASTSAVGVVVRPTTATVVLATNQSIGVGSFGAAVAISGTATVAGSVGATIIGVSNGVAINISTMPAITGSIGINSISAGVSIAINAISAGVTIGINSISATVNVAGVVFLNKSPAVQNSTNRGPKTVVVSTSANVTLIAAPGGTSSVFVTAIMAGNQSTSLTRFRCGPSSSATTVQQPLASSGGGFVYQFNPPWQLSQSEGLVCSIKPNAAEVYVTVHFYTQ